MANSRDQLASFIAKYSPDIARQFRAARATLRRLFPRGHELVYDNYNALGCGFSPTLRSSDILVSVVAYPKWVTLFFFDGRRLNDPDELLQGSGVRVRSLRLQPFALITSVAVGRLLAQAINESKAELKAAPLLSTVVKSVSVMQRPRRPAGSKSSVEVQEVPVVPRPKRSRHIEYHGDGSVRGKGWTRDGKLDGYWEWFRLDGTRLRSGSFSLDRQVGEWTTYDRSGAVYKVTRMPGSGPPSRAKRKATPANKSLERSRDR